MRSPVRIVLLLLACLLATPRLGVAQTTFVPPSFPLSDTAREAIEAPWLTEAEQADRRVFHGAWLDEDLADPMRAAQAALVGWREDLVTDMAALPAWMQAEFHLRRGEAAEALRVLEGDRSIAGARRRAAAHAVRGELEQAIRAADEALAAVRIDAEEDAPGVTDAVALMAIRARAAGQPARDWRTMVQQLGRVHQRVDRLYWPARLEEARLLAEKHQRVPAIEALYETLRLAPRCAEAWQLLGDLAVDGFDFEGAQNAVDALRELVPDHPLAAVLHARSRLMQDDPEQALEILDDHLSRRPRDRAALAVRAAAWGLLYDEAGLRRALADYDAVSPGGALALHEAGRALAMFRQYELASELLNEAIRRAPGWTAPRIELGMMELQAGRNGVALAVLQEAVERDPFDKRAANSLALLEELAEYATVDTEHYVIRYKPGIDAVLVDLMPEALERNHAVVAERFGLEPPIRTTIEVYPDHERFSVRITGITDIHTIAAATGPVIAMEVPRDGKPSQHRGVFDWERVLRHEYTHTVTLAATRNRIPHWLTEAAAVAMELAPRPIETCRLLAEALASGTLFPLDRIKWGFVRPVRPTDRALAYAQSHWMYEFMEERHGSEAIRRLLRAYFDGRRDQEAFESALGETPDAFYDAFLAWAREQVRAWGLAPRPDLLALTDELRERDPDLAAALAASRQARLDVIAQAIARSIGRPLTPQDRILRGADWPELQRPPVEIDDRVLDGWRAEHPDHPDVLELRLRRQIEAREQASAWPDATFAPDLERLLELRPVDEFAHRRLAEIHLASDDPQRAVEHLEALDAREENSPLFARELASLYRARGDRDRAYDKALRACRIDPYRPEYRELAAAIAVERRALAEARRHLVALTLLEPQVDRHRQRLARLDAMIGERPN